MSFWTEYVIADVSEAEAVAAHSEPRTRWPGFEGFKMFGPPHMAALDRALGNSSAVEVDQLVFGEEACVFELPPAQVLALAKLQASDLASVAAAWSASLGDVGERYDAEGLCALVANLRELAERADGRSVLMWQCMVG